MTLNITINKVAVATSFAAGATVATAVTTGGTAPYVYSLATGSDEFAINSSTGIVTTIAAMDINNISSFSVTVTDSTTGTALTGTSGVIYPPIQTEVQSKFNKPNVIYKITRQIDLKGSDLSIPVGCTLDFQGGSFINGVILGHNTIVINPNFKCDLKGTFLNEDKTPYISYPKSYTSLTLGTLTPIFTASLDDTSAGYDNTYVGVPVICQVNQNLIYMYYECKGGSSGVLKGKHIAFAYSTNGITFTKSYPPGVTHSVQTNDGTTLTDTNLIFYDLIQEIDVIKVPDIEYPFRMMANKLVDVSNYTNKTQVFWYKSKDGINWENEMMIIDAKLDSLPSMILDGNLIKVYHRLRGTNIKNRLIGYFYIDLEGNIVKPITKLMDNLCYNSAILPLSGSRHMILPTYYKDESPTDDSLTCFEVDTNNNVMVNNSFIGQLNTKIKNIYKGFTLIGNHPCTINVGPYSSPPWSGSYMYVHTRNYYHNGDSVDGESVKNSYICRIKFSWNQEGQPCPSTPI